MRASKTLLGGLALICTSCVSVANLSQPVNVYSSIPKDTRTVAIRVVPLKPGTLKNAGGLTDPGQFLARYIKDELALKQPSWEVRVLDGSVAASETDILVSTEVLAIDGGSAGLRFWIGFSAGAAESTVAVSVLDKNGKNMANATIIERTMCPIGACVDSNDDTIQRNLRNLAKEMATFILNPSEYKTQN
jgi:hypothetical protein